MREVKRLTEDGRWAGMNFANLEPGDCVEFSDIPGVHWLIKTEPKPDLNDGILFVEVEEIQGAMSDERIDPANQ